MESIKLSTAYAVDNFIGLIDILTAHHTIDSDNRMIMSCEDINKYNINVLNFVTAVRNYSQTIRFEKYFLQLRS